MFVGRFDVPEAMAGLQAGWWNAGVAPGTSLFTVGFKLWSKVGVGVLWIGRRGMKSAGVSLKLRFPVRVSNEDFFRGH